jgi:hypothetical protein
MVARAAIILVILTAIVSANAKQLSGHELAKFLGPVSPNLITWQKRVEPDAEIYFGKANPPLSGDIDISILGSSWSVFGRGGGEGQLGVFPNFWAEAYADEKHEGGFYIDGQQRKISIDINSAQESDLKILKTEISRLPIFNRARETPFRGIILRKRVARFVQGLMFPLLFLLSVWLPIRALHKRKASHLLRWAIFGAIALAWIIFFVSTWPFRVGVLRTDPDLAIFFGSLAGEWCLIPPALALVSLIAALLLLVWFLLQRFVFSGFAKRA